MAFLWISNRVLSFQSAESFGRDNNSFWCQFLLRVALAGTLLWVETLALNCYLPGTRRRCIKMNLSPFGPPSLPKVMSLPPSHKLQSRTDIGTEEDQIWERREILISHIQLSLQSYTICYTTEKFRIVSSPGPRHVVKFYNNSCHIIVSHS